jgi:hypothetical protein
MLACLEGERAPRRNGRLVPPCAMASRSRDPSIHGVTPMARQRARTYSASGTRRDSGSAP